MNPAGVRILIVDDDVDVQRALKRAAEAIGFEVVQAFDGIAGLNAAMEHELDFIVLEVELPKADGRDVLSALKQSPQTADIPVLIYSGGSNRFHDRRVVHEMGAIDHIEKPFDATLLMTRIRRVVEEARERALGSERNA